MKGIIDYRHFYKEQDENLVITLDDFDNEDYVISPAYVIVTDEHHKITKDFSKKFHDYVSSKKDYEEDIFEWFVCTDKISVDRPYILTVDDFLAIMKDITKFRELNFNEEYNVLYFGKWEDI